MSNYIILFFSICILIFFISIINKKIVNRFKNIKTYLLVILVLFLVSCLIIYPNNTINAALNGFRTWSNIILPSLMPFFIGAEVLIGLGVVNFFGVLLEPIMYPLFGVSGKGSFPFVMSISSGYPVGVTLVSKLRNENIIDKIEAQRLVSFCSTSGPLFMIGAVSIGMFRNPAIGTLLASSHYLGAITVGFLFKNYGKIENLNNGYSKGRINYFRKALYSLVQARKKDGRNISMLMSDSIRSSFESMFMIGGFIIIYSVIIEILMVTKFINFFSSLFMVIFPVDIDIELIKGFISGLLEVTNGCKLISKANGSSFISQLCAVSFLIGWSGLSIHSQAISAIGTTDINPKLYLLAKGLHAFISFIYSYILYKLFFKSIVVSFITENYSLQNSFVDNWLNTFKFSLGIELVMIVVTTVTALFIGALYNIKTILNDK
ncbi:sporulation integral membrane protein YlbJ [Proteiniborus ethanoligenes]|uniref:Sporulation integral membrane protein YlbJ n=1 Tax=Proteiniborus ethanoligenes TaxID=415015 RepID=A0A1H3PLQ7_9FIRM|nr:sporulation integral membrane protein YlbJ [Proteiniborus ethanoligenes]SDZ01948.1 sporulation integral membrane protein YlbJ [Proteiniborus ethanoligenes]